MADTTSGAVLSPKEKKRTRVQLSCTACRSRKLRCCRTHPCTNCIKRDEAHSCTFVGRGPKGKTAQGQTSPALIQERVQHLENLILSLVQKNQQAPNQNTTPTTPSVGATREQSNVSSQGSRRGSRQPPSVTPPTTVSDAEYTPLDPPSKLVVGETGESYIDSAHWSSILEEINGVKKYLQEDDIVSEEDVVDEEAPDTHDVSPTLLLGWNKPATIEELLSDVPPRQYTEFWSDPTKVSLPFLALLYGAITIVVLSYFRKGEPLPAYLSDYPDTINTMRRRAAQCLVQSNYTIPGEHKVKALFIYTMGEFYRSNDAQVSVSFLLGLTIKLAMRSGYHRDPRHFPEISPFTGEMRRRLWASLRQLDTLVSFQVGVPRTIQDWQQDVELPRNLSDEDFGEDTQELPPSRPETEMTRLLYTRAKGRVMDVFGKISDIAFSREPITYEETLELDRQLEEAHDQFPQAFRIRPIEESIMDPPELILQRFTLEVLYQKSRCVLHRRFLGEVHSNRYAYSRWACLSASKEILKNQANLYNETQPGGILYRDRLFPNSLQYADYVLAAMIICLELSYGNGGAERRPPNDIAVVIKGREDLLSVLQASHEIFGKSRRQSADAQKAYAALTIMLRRVQKGLQEQQPEQPSSDAQMQAPAGTVLDPPPYGSWQNPNDQPYTLDATVENVPTHMESVEPSFASLDVIEEMIDAPTSIDWGLWDQQILGLYAERTMDSGIRPV
ncbi:conserved hypothetical protein [Aspergillus terreus NIH2624]|uniref:Zn(2)-C6 fungal-type domain-containing protein n=1 Tax=Aspergillus terreus (strain NIH 2624 / FGSC A1156) TaxID=341663 RepID=Q0CRH4_ASPTN|nr:uncharacterized protein ATEG_03710 [Aspergillus terreus NIH2624]EAU35512.1 conserved hypothetical protein [Aspergillus terreus NIH2624]